MWRANTGVKFPKVLMGPSEVIRNRAVVGNPNGPPGSRWLEQKNRAWLQAKKGRKKCFHEEAPVRYPAKERSKDVQPLQPLPAWGFFLSAWSMKRKLPLHSQDPGGCKGSTVKVSEQRSLPACPVAAGKSSQGSVKGTDLPVTVWPNDIPLQLQSLWLLAHISYTHTAGICLAYTSFLSQLWDYPLPLCSSASNRALRLSFPATPLA